MQLPKYIIKLLGIAGISIIGLLALLFANGIFRNQESYHNSIDQETQMSVFDYIDSQSVKDLMQPNTIQVKVAGKDIDFNNFYSYPIDSLFKEIGAPEYQAGWIAYLNDYWIGPFANLFFPRYYFEEIPIKAYAWPYEDQYFVCLCIFDDDKMTKSFPLSNRWDFEDRAERWMIYNSTEEGLNLLLWAIVGSLDDVKSVTNYDKGYWIKFEKRECCDLRSYYLSEFELVTVSTAMGKEVRLVDLMGFARTEFLSYCGTPEYSHSYTRYSLPEYLSQELFIITDQVPQQIIVDRYISGYFPFDVFYDMYGKLFFMSMAKDKMVDIQY